MRAAVTLLALSFVSVVQAQNVKFIGILQDLVDQDMDQMDITDKCEEHMILVRNGLRDREIWALKMLDASSHIGSDFVWGNNILIGSPRSCNLISNPRNLRLSPDYIPVAMANLSKIKAPIRVGYHSVHARHFSEMQVDIAVLGNNVLNFGFCLPLSCNNADSFRLLDAILHNKTFIDRSLIGMNTEVIHTKLLQLRNNFLSNPFVAVFFVIFYLVLFLITLELGYSLTKKVFCWSIPIDSKTEKRKSKKFYEKFLACFSLVENAKIIFSTRIGEDSIEVLHGIRVIGMILFITGHMMLFAVSAVTNAQHILLYATDWSLQPLFTIYFTLDTFFVLSGMVLSYIFFQNLKVKPIRNRVSFYLRMVANRYLRLTPPYMVSLLLTVVVTKFVKDLSPYYLIDDDEVKCERYFNKFVSSYQQGVNEKRSWWYNLLYINNLFPLKESCLMWGWYIGADFQCFAISAALLLIYEKNPKLGISLFGFVYLATCAITGYYAYSLEYQITQDSLYRTVDYLYTPFWARISAYFAGVFAGWFLSTKDRTLDIDKKWIYLGWVLSFTVLVGYIFGHGNVDISPLTSLFYSALYRTVWGAAIIWIIIACSTEQGGIVNCILSAKVFLPFSRMSYSAYLVNPIWIIFVTMLNEAPYTIDFPMMPIMTLGFATTVYALAFVFMLLFENPFIRLVKLLTS